MNEHMRRLFWACNRDTCLQTGLKRATVIHDDHCGIFRQELCDCDPDITVDMGSRERVKVTREGFTVRVLDS